MTADCGIDVGGGRQPDLTIWAKGKPPRRARSSYAGLNGLLLAVEVVSPDSEMIDHVIKKAEYAAARVPRYWIVDGDKGKTAACSDSLRPDMRQNESRHRSPGS